MVCHIHITTLLPEKQGHIDLIWNFYILHVSSFNVLCDSMDMRQTYHQWLLILKELRIYMSASSPKQGLDFAL
jgi:hypothetical protein